MIFKSKQCCNLSYHHFDIAIFESDKKYKKNSQNFPMAFDCLQKIVKKINYQVCNGKKSRKKIKKLQLPENIDEWTKSQNVIKE